MNKFLSCGENYRIEIDLDENIDKLMETLNREISNYSKTKSSDVFDDFIMETNSNETQKETLSLDRLKNELETDNEILKLFN